MQTLRAVSSIRIELLDAPPAGSHWQINDDTENKFYYALDVYNEGSGGPEQQLQIWRQLGTKVILLKQSRQNDESGLAAFEPLFAIARSAKYSE